MTPRDRTAARVSAKMGRLADGACPRVVDLFAGCGGLFLGFHRAGCVSVAAVELDPLAVASFRRNFHPMSPVRAQAMDITDPENDPERVLSRLGHASPADAVDLVVGGPPCPAFTRVGRAKLREIHEHPEAFRHDPRATLYLPYLRWVEALAPVAVLMENVPDMLNWGGHNLGEEVCEALAALGYRARYTLLNSANHGVPQMRERMILIGIHESLGVSPAFPVPTHRVAFPSGYVGTRAVALKTVPGAMLGEHGGHFVPSPPVPAVARAAVSVEDALRDLPPLTAHLEGRDRRGTRRFTQGVPYRTDVATPYANEMRHWPGFTSDGMIRDHVTRCLGPRDHRLFALLEPGDDYPRAHRLAVRLFEDELRRLGDAAPVPGTPAFDRLRASFVPPYDAGKFPNKWRKMEPNLPARTLMAHLGKDSYSHIHYDSAQARVISVREAARLQSFPDGFVFEGTMNPAFRQIGNAVPPLLSWSLAKTLLATIRGALRGQAGDQAADRLRPDAVRVALPQPTGREAEGHQPERGPVHDHPVSRVASGGGEDKGAAPR